MPQISQSELLLLLLLLKKQVTPELEAKRQANTNTDKLTALATKARLEKVLWFTFSSVFYFEPELIADEGSFTAPAAAVAVTSERNAARPGRAPLGYECLPSLVMNEAMRLRVATVKEEWSVLHLQEVHPVLALAIDIERGFNTLNYDERLAIIHRYGLKRSFDEIGETMRYEPPTVRKVINRAIGKLAPFIVSLAQLADSLPDYSDTAGNGSSDSASASDINGSDNKDGASVRRKASSNTSKSSTGTGTGTGKLIDAAASARERRKLGQLHERLRQQQQQPENYLYPVIEGERFWERDSERERRELGQAENKKLSYVEQISQELFRYLRRAPVPVPVPAPAHADANANANAGANAGEVEELFYWRGYRGGDYDYGYRREVLLTKLYQLASNSTYTTEQIARKLFDPAVASGANSVQFASEFGFNYGQVVQVKRDLLARLVDWTSDGDIAVRYATSKSKLPMPTPIPTPAQEPELELGQAVA